MSQYTPFLCTCGCGCAPSNCKKIKSDQVVYWGPPITCLNIDYTKNFTEITQIFADILCGLTTTTSSTSSTSTTTTTTTIANCAEIYINVVKEGGNVAPVVTVVDSTFGETGIMTNYLGVGQYSVIFLGSLVPIDENTVILSGANNNPVSAVISSGTLFLGTFETDAITPSDGVLEQPTSFYLRHCTVNPSVPQVFVYNFSFGNASSALACANTTYSVTLYKGTPALNLGDTMYANFLLTIPFNGGNQWFHYKAFPLISIQINSSGVITNLSGCP